MKTELFSSVLLLTAYCSVTTVTAASINCNGLTTSACRIRFVEQYESEFKVLHLNALDDLFNTLESVSTRIVAELPKDDSAGKKLTSTMQIIRNHIKNIHQYSNDTHKIAAIIKTAMKDISWNADDSSEQIRMLGEKYRLKEILSDRMNELAIDVGKLYTEMYSGLRKEDLKEYPEYGSINEIMKQLQTNEKDEQKLKNYVAAISLLATQLNLPSLTGIQLNF